VDFSFYSTRWDRPVLDHLFYGYDPAANPSLDSRPEITKLSGFDTQAVLDAALGATLDCLSLLELQSHVAEAGNTFDQSPSLGLPVLEPGYLVARRYFSVPFRDGALSRNRPGAGIGHLVQLVADDQFVLAWFFLRCR